MSEPHVITVEEAAELLRISRNTAYEAVKRGEIPSVRVGRRILIPRISIMKMLGGEEATGDAATSDADRSAAA